ncbi:MAG: 2-oxoglutarate dehydrogenase E1 component [Planctomycetes bacterium]|nr:2-oxoglutarate dehydrogenase E1 component [Planctomycetota bacterium]
MRESDSSPNASNLAFAEDLYAAWLADPQAVSPDWRAYFESLPRAVQGGGQIGPRFAPRSIFNPPELSTPGANGHSGSNGHGAGAASIDVVAQDRLDQLVRSYRVRGHLVAQVDPLGRPRPSFPELESSFYGFGPEDMQREFSTLAIFGAPTMTLAAVIEKLSNTYCRSIGVQYMHIDDLARKNWLRDRMEGSENRLELTRDEQVRILGRLTNAVMFEEFIQKKFLGAKSFSLEGSESLIPLLDLAIERASEHGTSEIVIGMAHRGRLNVLANTLGKKPRQIFREFADVDPNLYRQGGDVKYHLGFWNVVKTSANRDMRLSLCFNPSHLEFVNPVAMGRVRAKQDARSDTNHEHSLALLIHGDAAFAGQGIIQEVLNLSQLSGYTTGGTVHVIVNNQIGFTTDPQDGRSTTYCTDVAKMLQIPIFHVNGEDPEAVAQVTRMAIDFRAEWKSDVVIDMYGYRRRGHNEGDEPAFTQPVMYDAIRRRKNVREGYLDHLLALNGVSRAEADEIAERSYAQLETELEASRQKDYVYQTVSLDPAWTQYRGGPETKVPEVETKVALETAAQLLLATTRVPDGFKINPKIERLLDLRVEMSKGEKPLDWAAGEALAYATLAVGGSPVRMTGQDCERGTFSHRHAVLHDTETGRSWMPLAHLKPDQARVEIYNSPLSEMAVLGFEYGYTLDAPSALVLWEAQFGDFNNGAQVIIDQFLVSAEDKWKRLSGLTMLLPHGFEGQGPEHSSARLERFLQMCAEDNIQVVNLTTPANLFHCLRRQALRSWRKPLVVMSPKSLLRHPKVVSNLDEFANGSFQRIIGDVAPAGADKQKKRKITRVLLCSGKIYYELEDQREKLGRHDVAILRFEQLYPLSDEHIAAALEPYGAKTPVVWVQEEPQNMGAWSHFRVRFGDSILGRPFRGETRAASASPATGSPSSHRIEQQEILDRAFAQD